MHPARMKYMKIAVYLLLLFGTGAANSALISFDITGLVGDPGQGLDYPDTISLTGMFDDSVIAGGISSGGTIIFSSSSGNSLSMIDDDHGGTIINYNEMDDTRYSSSNGAKLVFSAGGVFTSFEWRSSTLTSDFIYFTDPTNNLGLAGQWIESSFTPVPIPAAFWLFGSGLLGLLGVTRRKRNKV